MRKEKAKKYNDEMVCELSRKQKELKKKLDNWEGKPEGKAELRRERNKVQDQIKKYV